MANGRLGAADLAATTNTTIYTVPASTVATVTITVCNRNATSVQVRLAHLDGAIGTLANEDYFVYDDTIVGNKTMVFSGIPMASTHIIMARASATNVSVQVVGFENSV